MKLTKSKREWVKNRIIKYCNEMNCERPSWLFLKASEWNEWKEYNKKKDGWKRFRNAAPSYLGICDREGGAIAIFVKKFISLDALDRTIRHELAHWVRSYNHRGQDFARIMDEIKKGKLKANRRGFSLRKFAPLGIMMVVITLLFSAPCVSFASQLKASWYSEASLKKEGTWKTSKGEMANGKQFDETKFTCASRLFPLGTTIEVTNISTRARVCVKVTDRIGKRFATTRIDLSKSAFQKIASLKEGLIDIEVKIIK